MHLDEKLKNKVKNLFIKWIFVLYVWKRIL